MHLVAFLPPIDAVCHLHLVHPIVQPHNDATTFASPVNQGAALNATSTFRFPLHGAVQWWLHDHITSVGFVEGSRTNIGDPHTSHAPTSRITGPP